MATVSIPIKKHQTGKVKTFVYLLKNNIISFIICLFCIGLVVFSQTNLKSAKNGLILWATAVVPSLFPFFVSTELLSYTNIVKYLGKCLTPITRALFNVPGEGAFAFIMGLISGYPVGAKIVSNFVEQKIITVEEAERLLAFTNNSGPLFIIGTVGINFFGSATIGIILFITHILACITVGVILKFTAKTSTKYNKNYNVNTNKKNITIATLGDVLSKSITNSISTILMIGGYVVVFSVIISILNQSGILNSMSKIIAPVINTLGFNTKLAKPILYGIIELTNGVNLVANTAIPKLSENIIISSFLLGFGGISVLLQVLSIVSKTKISIKKYIIGKVLQGIFAAIYTYIILKCQF